MLLILGDSHTFALKHGLALLADGERAALRARYGGIGIETLHAGYKLLRPFHAVRDGGVEFTRSFIAKRFNLAAAAAGSALTRIAPNDPRKFLFVLGAHGIGFYMDRCWTMFDPGRTPAKSYISDAAFRRMVLHFDRSILTFFDALQAINADFEVIFCCPLPRAQWASLKDLFESAGEMGDLMQRFRSTYARELDDRGIPYHLPPSHLLSGPFLRSDLVSTNKPRDYHASPEYGAEMLRHILGNPRAHTS